LISLKQIDTCCIEIILESKKDWYNTISGVSLAIPHSKTNEGLHFFSIGRNDDFVIAVPAKSCACYCSNQILPMIITVFQCK
jgi:mannitol/fructose-specific phosphotransferase system IIA component (Ntr-type)